MPIQHCLPWFTLADRQAAAHLTVRHLLNQTSGFTMGSEWHTPADFDQSPTATEKQARELASFKPARAVGSKYEYSNTNYNPLGLVVEAASGERYADYLRNHVLRPLDMNNTFTSKPEAKVHGMSTGYASQFGFPVAVPNLAVPIGSLPSGQIISSAEDLAHFLIAQLNNRKYNGTRILSPKGIDAVHQAASDATTMGMPMAYAMGWFVEKTRYGTLLRHDGTAPDFFSYMALLPDQQKATVLLMNTNELVMNFAAFSFLGGDIASLWAGADPSSRSWGTIPWVLRAFLLIPIVQILSAFVFVRRVQRRRRSKTVRPGGLSKWVYLVLLPIPNLVLLGAALYFVAGGVLRFWLLFMGDLTWLMLLCGGLAAVWIIVRTWFIVDTLRIPSA